MKLKKIEKKLGKKNKKVVCIFSGGLDSTILLYLLVSYHGKGNVYALTFDYNQRHSIELEKAKLTCKKLEVDHKIVDLTFLSDFIGNVSALTKSSKIDVPDIKKVLGHPQPVTYVPYRNLLLSSLSFSYAESIKANYIYMGLQKHDLYSYWDTSPEFVEAVNNVSKLNRKNKIKIKTPFVNFEKSQEIKIGKELNVDFEDTWTCYNPVIENGKTLACGKCPSCAERIGNFKKIGMKDPIDYAIEIEWG